MISDREIEAEQARAEEALERHQMKAVERCGNCRYWDEELCICRRNPPVVMPEVAIHDGLSADHGFWPTVDQSDWCGEWKPVKETLTTDPT